MICINKFLKSILVAGISTFTIFSNFQNVEANGEKIIFIPHDSRPISNKQTAEVIKKLGYKVVTPPMELLGNESNLGAPDKLWEWLEKNSDGAVTAVISSDSMLYGSLVASRKHFIDEQTIERRIENFEKIHEKFPYMKMFTFASIMRTPRTGEKVGSEENDYYQQYGASIFQYTALLDKQETEPLTKKEKKSLKNLENSIPKDALDDWMGRRNKNFNANKKLVDLTRKDIFGYFLLGRDDNAPFCQTHRESRYLKDYAKDLGKTRMQTVAGIDELALLMLTRAVNTITGDVPFIYAKYNIGTGGDTIPKYSDEKISQSVEEAILSTGAFPVQKPENADVVLLVNTNVNGETYESMNAFPGNYGQIREGTMEFADMVSDCVGRGYPVAVADIAFGNGSDNALMNQLRDRALLFKLRAYAGWNTPTNSTGFVLGTAMLTKRMSEDDLDELLITRYLDDWAYQSNVRRIVSNQMDRFRHPKASIVDIESAIEARSTKLMNRFIEENFPPFDFENVQVKFPWHRMFEADVIR